MSIFVYGIKTCSSCKKALKWLEANGFEHTWVDTRKTPPSKEKIESDLETLNQLVKFRNFIPILQS